MTIKASFEGVILASFSIRFPGSQCHIRRVSRERVQAGGQPREWVGLWLYDGLLDGKPRTDPDMLLTLRHRACAGSLPTSDRSPRRGVPAVRDEKSPRSSKLDHVASVEATILLKVFEQKRAVPWFLMVRDYATLAGDSANDGSLRSSNFLASICCSRCICFDSVFRSFERSRALAS